MSNQETYSEIRETLNRLGAPPGETIGERIEGLGGEFSTGRAAGGGFRIEARLPAMPSKTFEESVHE